jgi:hypothetical protein
VAEQIQRVLGVGGQLPNGRGAGRVHRAQQVNRHVPQRRQHPRWVNMASAVTTAPASGGNTPNRSTQQPRSDELVEVIGVELAYQQ